MSFGTPWVGVEWCELTPQPHVWYSRRMATIGTSIRLDEDLVKRLDELAELRSESRSALIERILNNGVADEEQFWERMQNPVYREVSRLILRPDVAMAMAKVLGERLDPAAVAGTSERFDRAVEKLAKRGQLRKGLNHGRAK